MTTRRSIATHKQVTAATAFLVRNGADLGNASATRIARRLADEEGITIEPAKVREIASQLGIAIRKPKKKDRATIATTTAKLRTMAAAMAAFMEAVGYDVPAEVKELCDGR